MIRILLSTAVLLLSASTMVLAEPSSDPATGKPGAAQSQTSEQSTSTARPVPEKAGLSKRNKAKLEQAEQRKIRQDEIDKERAAESAK